MGELSSALAAALDQCGRVLGNRPIDISKGLRIDMKLAWKASHLANTTSALEAVRHVPGVAGMKILVDGLAACDVPAPAVERLESAFEVFRSLIATTAGSRRAFESMVAGIDVSRDRRLETEHRRLLFDGASSVWGMRAEAVQRMDVLFPSSIVGLLDCVTVRAVCNARRLRESVALPFPRPRIVDDGGTQLSNVLDEPLDPDVEPGAFPILADLCRGEIPSFRRRPTNGGGVHEAEPSDSADAVPFTIASGETLRAVQPTRVGSSTHGIFQLMRLRIPAARAIFDVLVHEDLVEDHVEPEVYVASDLHGAAEGVGEIRRVRLPLDLRARVIPLRETPVIPDTIDVGEISARALKVAGHPLERFRWFRMELAYPPISTTLAFECEQPSV